MPLLRLLPPTLLAAGALLAGTTVGFAVAAQEDAQVAQQSGEPNAAQGPGRGMRGPGAMERHGPGAMQHHDDRCERMAEHLGKVDRKLTPEQVRDIVAGRLAQSGLNTLKVGKVRTSGDVVSIDVVTSSGAVVNTREISTKTGLAADLVSRCQARSARETAEHAKADDGPQQRFFMRGRFGGPMGHGMGHGGMGRGPMMAAGGGPLAIIGNEERGRDLNLTADQARKLADASLVRVGNPNLKVGAVKEKDADTITVDIVAKDNSLVMRQEMDRHNGRVKHAA